MEIEFTVQIDRERRRHEVHAALAFVTATTLGLLLVGLFFPPLSSCLVGAWTVLAIRNFDRYRSMRRQWRNPDKMVIRGDTLIYYSNSKACFSLLLATISRIDFRKGLRIFLTKERKVTVLDPQFSLAKFIEQSTREQCDLFFGWFDLSAKTRLEDIVHSHQAYYASPLEHR
jgi:hypothetical protein